MYVVADRQMNPDDREPVKATCGCLVYPSGSVFFETAALRASRDGTISVKLGFVVGQVVACDKCQVAGEMAGAEQEVCHGRSAD